jgi:hypothetical protein
VPGVDVPESGWVGVADLSLQPSASTPELAQSTIAITLYTETSATDPKRFLLPDGVTCA